jgi:hypothetical protein
VGRSNRLLYQTAGTGGYWIVNTRTISLFRASKESESQGLYGDGVWSSASLQQ